jgi:hypothetical protein
MVQMPRRDPERSTLRPARNRHLALSDQCEAMSALRAQSCPHPGAAVYVALGGQERTSAGALPGSALARHKPERFRALMSKKASLLDPSVPQARTYFGSRINLQR